MKRKETPLNKYLANAGACSRRKAVDYIKEGLIKVNDVVIKEPGHKIKDGDKVTCKNKLIIPQKKIYILLNKPRDYVTTLSDDRGRRTVIDLVKGVAKERIYPVGRLDRATTGLLLMTNDGDLAQKLAHPRNEVKKVYNVVLRSSLSSEDMKKIGDGIKLRDGKIKPDKIIYTPSKRKNNVTIYLHSGKKRIVRRIFEHLGYVIVKLDRINYAGLTKRGIPMGRFRLLTDYEIQCLKEFGEWKKK